MNFEKLYTVEEVARWLQVSRDMIEKAVRDGKLVAIRPGGGRNIRIKQSALEAWMNMPTA
jgi:excisionase family DNA binding protein